MAIVSSMSGLRKPRTAADTKKTILEVMSGITADLDEGFITETLAFDILCQELGNLSGSPVAAGNHHPSC